MGFSGFFWVGFLFAHPALFCRPIRFQYVKESVATVEAEAMFIEGEMDILAPTLMPGFSVEHKLEMTMVDGKVTTILSDQTCATTSCSICGITSSKMNYVNLVEQAAAAAHVDGFKHRISTLHL